MEVGDGVNSTCADCLAIIKYIRDRVATSKSMEEALEVIEKNNRNTRAGTHSRSNIRN